MGVYLAFCRVYVYTFSTNFKHPSYILNTPLYKPPSFFFCDTAGHHKRIVLYEVYFFSYSVTNDGVKLLKVESYPPPVSDT